MRTTLKLVAPLIVSVALVSLLFAGYQVRTQKRILRSELTHRSETLGESLQESVESLSERSAERDHNVPARPWLVDLARVVANDARPHAHCFAHDGLGENLFAAHRRAHMLNRRRHFEILFSAVSLR